MHTQLLKIKFANGFNGVPDDTLFKVAKVWCHGNVVFVKQAEEAKQVFTWYNVDNPEDPFIPITRADGTPTGYKYRCNKDMTQAELRREVDKNTDTLVKLSDANRADIANLLQNVFKAEDKQWVADSIKDFMDSMEKE